MRHSHRITALFVAAAVVAAAAGCGGGSPSAGPASNTGATGTTGATGAGAMSATGVIGPSGSNGSNFASAKNCLAFAGVAAKIASAMAPASSGSEPQAVAREFQAFADAAPSEVKGDFQTLADAFSGYMTALSNSGYTLGSSKPPTAAQLAALVHAGRVFNTSKLKAAEKNLQSWANANCKAP